MADEIVKLTAKDDTRGAFASLQRNLDATRTSASRLATLLPAIGVGLSAAGVVQFVRNSINAADALNDLSERTGVAVERLSAFQYAAKLSDVSNESLAAGLRGLARSIAEGDKGFAQLGVSVKDAGGNLRASDQVLLDVAERFSQLEDGPGKAALAMQLFGKSGADLIPLLNSGKAGLQKFADEAARLGVVVSQDTARAAAQFNDNMDRLSTSLQGVGFNLANVTLPAMNQLLAKFSEASDRSGPVWGLIRAYAELGKITLQGGPDLVGAEKQAEFVKRTRNEIAALEKSIAGKDPSGTGLINRLLYGGNREEQERKLAGLRLTLQGAQKSLQQIEQAAAAPAPAKEKLRAPVDDTAAKRAAQERLQAEIRAAQETGRITAATYADRVAVIEAEWQVQQEAVKRQEEAAKDAEDARKRWQSAVEGLLGQTEIGQRKALEQQLADLAEFGRLNPDRDEEVTQAFERINVQLQKIKGVSADSFQTASDEGRKAFDRLQQAVEGWGRSSADAFASFVTGAKVNFGDLVMTMIRELISLQAYKSVFQPLFSGASEGLGKYFGLEPSAKGNVFGPDGLVAFAKGGIVNGPTVFPFANGIGLMGEAGPEAVMPLRRGADGRLGVQASGGAGVNVVIHNYASGTEARAQPRMGADGSLTIDVIVDMVTSRQSRAIRDGQGLAYAIEGTYGVRRRT